MRKTGLFKKGLVTLLLAGGFFLISGFSNCSFQASEMKSEIDRLCNITQARQFLKTALPRYSFENATFPDYEVKSAERIDLKDLSICQVVFKPVYNIPEEKKSPYMKNDEKLFRIVYILSPDAFVFGDLFMKKGDSFQNITFTEFRKYNEEFIKSLDKEPSDRSVSSVLVKEAISMADISFDKKKKVSVVIFADPYCPYCHRMLETAKKYLDEINLYVVFTPVLGPKSMDVSVNALCEEKNMRFSAFLEKRTGKKCQDGEKKVQRNLEFFGKLQAQGVPVTLIYRSGDKTSEKVIGSIAEEVFVKKIRDSKDKP